MIHLKIMLNKKSLGFEQKNKKKKHLKIILEKVMFEYTIIMENKLDFILR